MASLITFHEKHEERRFVVNTDDDLNKLALMILRERHTEGKYPTLDEILEVFKSSIECIVTASINDPSDKRMNADRAELEQWFRENSEFIDTLEILMNLPEDQALKYTNDKIAECDPYMALALLKMRQFEEYESFTVHEIEEVFGFRNDLSTRETSVT